MTQLVMPRGKAGSPVATLTGSITATSTTIPFDTSNLTDDVPNIVSITVDGETFETIKYITKNAGNVVCESAVLGRGFDGTTAQAWAEGASVARYVSAYDLDAHASNIEDHETRITTLEGSSGLTFDDAEGQPAALGDAAADGTSEHPARRDHAHIKPSPADIGAATSGHTHDYTGTFAPIAKGVTNGDTHDHSGGDGAQIVYSTLGSIPSTFEPNAHKDHHATGGSDALTAADIGAAASDHTHGASSSSWTAWPVTFTATPASTSTITTTDATATVKVGMPLKYTIGGVVYYGQVTAITASLVTIAGAPLGGDITALAYGDASKIEQVLIAIPGYYEDANDTTLIANDLGVVYVWKLPVAYLVNFSAKTLTADSSSNGKVNVRVNSQDVCTTSGGLTLANNSTIYTTVVDISTTYYDINFGEYIELNVTKGTGGNATYLTVILVFVKP